MRLRQGHKHSRGNDRATPFTRGEPVEDTVTHNESEVFAALSSASADKYSAWLEQRRQELGSDERAPVRWIHRGPLLRDLPTRRRIEQDDTSSSPLVGV